VTPDRARAVKGAVQPDLDDAVPALGGKVHGCHPGADAGVVDQHVDPPESIDRFRHGLLDAGLVGDVELQAVRFGAGGGQLARDRLRGRPVDVGHHHARPAAPEGERARPADPRAAARNEHDPAPEPEF
jgi:hypothetical protein